jgi:hypothetical protein
MVIGKFHFEGVPLWTSRDDLKGLFWRQPILLTTRFQGEG